MGLDERSTLGPPPVLYLIFFSKARGKKAFHLIRPRKTLKRDWVNSDHREWTKIKNIEISLLPLALLIVMKGI